MKAKDIGDLAHRHGELVTKDLAEGGLTPEERTEMIALRQQLDDARAAEVRAGLNAYEARVVRQETVQACLERMRAYTERRTAATIQAFRAAKAAERFIALLKKV